MAAMIAADALHRAIAARSSSSCRTRRSWRSGPPVEADQRDLEIAGVTEEIHDFHQVAIAHRLVGAQVNALVFLALGRGVQRRRECVADNDVLADRDRQIRLDGDEYRLFRPRL